MSNRPTEPEKSLPVVNVLGAGVRGRKQLTLEAVDYLVRAPYVLFFPFGSLTAEWLTSDLRVSKTESLAAQYHDGAVDWENYYRIVNRILEAALEFGTVTVLVPGHPRVGVSWIQLLEERESSGLIRLHVMDGISSIDTMITDLGRDPLEHGAVVVDANRLQLFNLQIDPRLDLYLYHVCSVGTSNTNFSNPALDNRLDLLRSFLLGHYPARHEVQLVESKRLSGEHAVIQKVAIEELPSLASVVTFATSLFIPGLPISKEVVDSEFFRLLEVKGVSSPE